MIAMMIVFTACFVLGSIGLYVIWLLDLLEAERAARPGPNDRRKDPRPNPGRRRCDQRMSNADWRYHNHR